jgi:hypothetical protein
MNNEKITIKSFSQSRLLLTIPEDDNYLVELFTVSGRLLHKKNYSFQKGVGTINLSLRNIGNQMVILKVLSSNSMVVKKVRIQ